MSNNISIRTFLIQFNSGAFNKEDRNTLIEAGWYDWFCKDTLLAKKTKNLTEKLKSIAGSPRINLDTQYVFFKNNCPMNGPLYDDFRICDLQTGDVIFTVTPKSGHTGKAEVYGTENDFQTPLAQGTWKDVVNYFLN